VEPPLTHVPTEPRPAPARDAATEGALALLAAAPLFAKLPPRVRATLVERAVMRRLAPGERVLTAGAVNTSLFVVVEGALDVRLPDVEAPIVRLGPGECAGELSLIDGQPVSADVVAAAASVLLELRQDHVWVAVETSAVFARNLLRVLAGRVRHDDALIAESTGARRHYERLSLVDSLTGLNNRRGFDLLFPRLLVRLQKEGRPGALLMADLDRFKALNDQFGHAEGDAVLRRVGPTLAAALRPGDLLARYGGEEFAALLADLDENDAHDVAERLRARVAEPPADGPACTVSIGIAIVRADEPLEDLVRRADAALFRAKQAGRNRVSS
jgi:diguanylate cyclase (GGDEF)-like protein